MRIIAEQGDRVDGHGMGRPASLGVRSIRVLNRFKLAFAEENAAEKPNIAQPTGRYSCWEKEARGWGYGIGRPQDDPVGCDR